MNLYLKLHRWDYIFSVRDGTRTVLHRVPAPVLNKCCYVLLTGFNYLLTLKVARILQAFKKGNFTFIAHCCLITIPIKFAEIFETVMHDRLFCIDDNKFNFACTETESRYWDGIFQPLSVHWQQQKLILTTSCLNIIALYLTNRKCKGVINPMSVLRCYSSFQSGTTFICIFYWLN